jgi:general secretion pathway protein G
MGESTEKQRRRRPRAFTLIELLVVVTIIGILAALIVPRVFGRVGGAKQAVARQKIAVLENTIGQFKIDCGRLPTPQEGLQALVRQPGDCGEKWKGPYVKDKDILDPWDVEFIYRSPGQRNADFDLMTFGADKQEGGSDENEDLGNW